ncbi:ABC transporter permease [Agaribacterium haliotis]|uniref:ABC transporter permease n=1 Tax=Agaribacterium haliotis TaxID=2013869 RepID=UPI001EFEAE4E|nr:ABC transporter permease [Agaribacterium haliotis]
MKLSFSRFSAIVVKEFAQLSRDHMTFAMVLMIPIVQLLLFGYAINTDVRNIPVGVVNQSQNKAAQIIEQAVEATQVVDVKHYYLTTDEAEDAIVRGEVRAVLVFPPDLGRRIASDQVVAQWMVDASDTMLGAAILQLRSMPLNQLFQDPALAQNRSEPSFEVALFFNPTRRSAVNIVPGLVAVILTMTMTMVMFTATAIVRERERGNLEFLITTPIHPLELMAGKIVPFIFIGLFQVSLILGLGHYLMQVPIVGSLLDVYLATLLFIGASLILGLIISTLAKTQLQAMQMTVFILLPSILLSGFMFPYEAMPKAAQYLAEVLPATHFMRMIRATVLRGAEIHQLLPDVFALLIISGVGICIAALRFNKSLD